MDAAATNDASVEASSLRDHIDVVRRRKWVVVGAVVLVPFAALLFTLRQAPLYQATAEVLVNWSSPAALAGATDTTGQQPERLLQTQADLASVPQVTERVLRALKLDRTPDQFVAASSVSLKRNSNILRFTVNDERAGLALRLATEYARQYTIYRRALDTVSIRRARRDVAAQIAGYDARGERASPVYDSLVAKHQELATLEALQRSNASLVRPASQALQIQPKPKRNIVLGLVLGAILGLGLAFLREALDMRVRTTEEIERRLGLPLLARIPEPPRWLQRTNQLVMLTSPNSLEAEAFRVLRTSLDFFNLEHRARVVMVTSAVQGEGKSTTIANLAVALSRAGQRVVLVDLDLRRPMLDRFFVVDTSVGLTDLVAGRALLAAVDDSDPAISAAGGRLEILTTGTLPRDTGEFVGSDNLGTILDALRERADIVLVDSPPLLAVGDALALSARVDGIVVITRLGLVRRAMLDELRRVLSNCQASKLGFVVSGAGTEREHRYGYGRRYGYGDRHEAPTSAEWDTNA